eukprot:CAMPEP_0203961064 /NCGR_PEP_ID=MMETSP0359-20131031/91599_1 /ASSEMBLY_ACC=CAM_ASM_000338 /TAXON_ID=268821 /ORGANISM="Scrippsiella Hangoei, Strain SHTV-5" /LENGTH=44 /DNA_ID= /DNA_START= /DNA_END= /DNA_ORIENTATION=
MPRSARGAGSPGGAPAGRPIEGGDAGPMHVIEAVAGRGRIATEQ